MSLQNHSKEVMAKMSLVEHAKIIMLEERKPMKFNDLYNKVAALKGLSEEEKLERIGQFYTDLNADGTFVSNGSNTWGLKRWYSNDQKEKTDEIQETPRKLKRKLARRKKQALVEEDDTDIDIDLDLVDEKLDDFDDELDYDEDFDLELEEDYDELLDEEEN